MAELLPSYLSDLSVCLSIPVKSYSFPPSEGENAHTEEVKIRAPNQIKKIAQ